MLHLSGKFSKIPRKPGFGCPNPRKALVLDVSMGLEKILDLVYMSGYQYPLIPE